MKYRRTQAAAAAEEVIQNSCCHNNISWGIVVMFLAFLKLSTSEHVNLGETTTVAVVEKENDRSSWLAGS